MFLAIEIGGTKLQLGLGSGDGLLVDSWRGVVDPAAGAEGIRQQILTALPLLLTRTGVERSQLQGVGVGFGGPIDDATQTVITSHQIAGWDGFRLADWIGEITGLPGVLGNDADVAALAEALHGAGKGLSPIFYITLGSGIGGGLVIDGQIYRGCGRGAVEVGHLRVADSFGILRPLELVASGWAIGRRASMIYRADVSAEEVARRATGGDVVAREILAGACAALAEALCHVVALLCPRRIVLGGGVSLMDEELLMRPLRVRLAERVFGPFAGCLDVVKAALGEAVVLHGAIALARQWFGAGSQSTRRGAG